jgi:trimethylamine--corrinoid protein Co-methyltransferase
MGNRRRTRRHRRRHDVPREETTQVTRLVQPLQRLPVYALADEEAIEQIHQASLQILAEIGIAFYDDEALAILKAHGAEVDADSVVRFDPALVESFLAYAPAQFTQLARNPHNNVVIGGNHICFAPVYGPPFVVSLNRGRREATLSDFNNFVRLTYLSPYLHHSGGTIVEPTDLPTATRHLDMVHSHILYGDKAFMGSVTSAENAADSVAQAEILFGREAIEENPALLSLINISSPRRLDDRMLGALKVYARANQATIITPFVLSGAMAPVSIAGTVAQLNAEALAGIVFAQMCRPGAPVIYGSFQTTIDLQSGAPVFGAPESQLSLYLSAQMARRYRLPFRSGGMFASAKIADIQSGYESVMAMLPAVMGGVNFVLHAAGWLENGLSAGYEKFVLDCEVLGMFHKYLQGVDFSADAFALESIRNVEPGGHHLGTDHTLRHFRTAFYRADLFDYNSAEQWQVDGAKDGNVRAHEKVQKLLKAYVPPPLDPGIQEALEAFMNRRKKEIVNQPTV